MITLNLLPEIKREYLRARRTQARVISGAIMVCMVSVGAVALVAFWVYAVQSIHKNALDNGITDKAQELKDIKDIDKYVTIQSQLANLSGLHQKKTVTSRLFDIMSKLNPKSPNNIRITNLELDTDTMTIVIDGETDSFTGLETFRDTLKNASLSYAVPGEDEAATDPFVEKNSVTVLSQGLGKTADASRTVVVFKLSLQYNPAAFVRDSGNVNVTVPDKDTTQSKQDSPDVFSAPQATGEGQ